MPAAVGRHVDYAKRLCAHHVAPGYPNTVSCAQSWVDLRRRALALFHEFWPDNVSLLDAKVADSGRIHGRASLRISIYWRWRCDTGGSSLLLTAQSPSTLSAAPRKTHLVIL
jgi:hypothetical protein